MSDSGKSQWLSPLYLILVIKIYLCLIPGNGNDSSFACDRAEQEKKLAQQKKEEEERLRKEEAEKKAKEAEEKRKRLEEAEKKRQAMMQAQKEKQAAAGQGAKGGAAKSGAGVSLGKSLTSKWRPHAMVEKLYNGDL